MKNQIKKQMQKDKCLADSMKKEDNMITPCIRDGVLKI